jgi:hypothetical protein
VFQPDHLTPPFLSLIFNRPGKSSGPGWRIKVSVTVRWGRSPSCMTIRDADRDYAGAAWLAWRSRRRRAHTVISITCTGHPWTRSHRQRLRTKPECYRSGEAWKNVVEDFETDGTTSALGPRDFGIMSQPGIGADSGIGSRDSGLGHRRSRFSVPDSGNGSIRPGGLKVRVLGWLRRLQVRRLPIPNI